MMWRETRAEAPTPRSGGFQPPCAPEAHLPPAVGKPGGYLRLCVITVLLFAPAGWAAEMLVANASEIAAAMAKAAPGDTLVMRDGAWADQPRTGGALNGAATKAFSSSRVILSGVNSRPGGEFTQSKDPAKPPEASSTAPSQSTGAFDCAAPTFPPPLRSG